MPTPLPSIRLAVRADDAGSSLSANKAIEESVDAGIARNVSIMAPGPFFEDAVQRFAKPIDICLGLHITLNAELFVESGELEKSPSLSEAKYSSSKLSTTTFPAPDGLPLSPEGIGGPSKMPSEP